jgi:hypothetical protein
MTDIERIVYLRAALKELALSADRYIDSGSWIEHLHLDIQEAYNVLEMTRSVDQSIRDAVGRSMKGEK